ncbi:uracil-DNA glycosylase family protein [Halorubrum sp. SD626R]|uniref:uracil-DNA glycosylase family protein n=1 Tax=Halorubrum sp. SD626R TaxID=1419722 RepID=UPI000AEB99E5|nr:uracil-DNA glycosylase family protein [Halorubrum sp. SD626R]TKX80163.1 uracil-DNA glycosylase [Halorubrum sp. SD626R]
MQNVTDRTRNPFGMRPDCGSFVPGYGDANADFHVVGDHPGVHGGVATGVPFTGEPWSPAFLSALTEGGLIAGDAEGPAPDGTAPEGGDAESEPVRTERTYLSYLHMCVPDGEPTAASYDDMERFFDAELRAIAAHVLLPVGAKATEHVLEQYTARAWKTEVDMAALHGEELLGSGWLVLPIRDPAEWEAGDADRLVDALLELRSTDFRRESDLGRFVAGSDPYLVR